MLKVSALSGKNVVRVLPALRQAEEAYHTRIPTASLNRLLQEAQSQHPPPPVRRHRPRVLYATQGASDPPTFTLFATHELAADVSPLPRAPHPRRVRPRTDADQAPGPPPQRLSARQRHSIRRTGIPRMRAVHVVVSVTLVAPEKL